LNTPVSLAFDSAGNLYTANLSSNNVTRYDKSGNLIGGVPFVSGIASGSLGVAFDKSGNLYVARGAGQNTITRYDPSGNLIGGGPFAVGPELDPYGLVFNLSGNLYSVNYGYNTITQYDSSGNKIGSNVVSTGLNKPQTLAFDTAGNFYVTNDNGISKYNSTGVFQFSWSVGASPRSVAFKPSSVPEPSTYALGLIAAGTLAWVARRRRQRQNIV
ncbi:MAG: PEP-CTERM sorting domain-containing protein, partial [Isosphaeraceae bacterium]